ncbi:E3 ubiquitin-protein ligase TRIM17-like isoform X1 [Pseudorasbora parva]|uniref:E3 ubiquitin-protein ligase TRIM17-like isoform X1 n=1 Tax=Pseudorasbora parva TaxID=51549 RepID=UPI00351F690C
MASRSFAEEDLSCPVCCDIFINPVLLSCSHSVCSTCIQRVWENKTLKECPVCRRSSLNDDPPLNLALRNLCESFLQENRQKSSPEAETVCSVHKEQFKLFCLDDQQPVCVVCRDSRKHTDHRFCPVDEAAADNKEILKASLEHLQERLRISVDREQNLRKTAGDIKFKAQCTEMQIREEFNELHQLLHDEETFRLTALREEEEQKSLMMKEKTEETSKQISSLTSTIRDIEQQMKAEDVSFLQNFKATMQRAQFSLPDPDLIPSVTTTFTDHLTNLKLSVLQKMQDNVGKKEGKEASNPPKFTFINSTQKGKKASNPLNFTFINSPQEGKEASNPPKFTFINSTQEKRKEMSNPPKFTFINSTQEERKEASNPPKFTFINSTQEERKEASNPPKFTFINSTQEGKKPSNPLKFTFVNSPQKGKGNNQPKFTFVNSTQEGKEASNPPMFTSRKE